MQNIPHDLGFIFCQSAPCGLSLCSRKTSHFHCRFCGFGTSQVGNAIAHGSRLCTGQDGPHKDFGTGCSEGVAYAASQPYAYYPQGVQAGASGPKQQGAMFNFVMSGQGTQYNGIYGPQTVFPNANLFSPSGFSSFGQVDAAWMAQSRLMTASAPAPSPADPTCCRIDVTALPTASPLSVEACKVETKEMQSQSWYSTPSVAGSGQQKYPDSVASSCSISLLFLEQNKDEDDSECINVDDICFSPKAKVNDPSAEICKANALDAPPSVQMCFSPKSKASSSDEILTPKAEAPPAPASTSDDSVIVVEESDSEGSEASEDWPCCFVCETKPTINCFTPITAQTPLTTSSRVPVWTKLAHVLDVTECPKAAVCARCLDLINAIDALQAKLGDATKELKDIYKSGKENLAAVELADESRCQICDKSFSSPAYLAKHQLHHNKAYSFYCEYCGKGFMRLRKLELHVLSHSDVDAGAGATARHFQCELCGKQFLEKHTLVSHVRQHQGQHRFHCPVCAKGFVQKNVYKVHVQSHGEARFVCQHCGRTIKTHSNLQVHMRVCSGDLRFKCDKCAQSFALKSLLEKHIATKHKLTFRFTCPVCGKGFWKESDLNAHASTHTNAKPFKCLDCGNAYKSSKNLTHHMRLHGAGGPRFACRTCGKAFTRADALADHVNAHSGRKPYECSICWQRFANRINFNGHVRKHRRDRQGSTCLVCQRHVQGSLAAHMQVHEARRAAHACSLCPALFAFKNSLNKHLKAKHGQWPAAKVS